MVRSEDAPPGAGMRGAAELRERFLETLDGDVIPMAHLDNLISCSRLAPSAAARHSLALGIISALLRDNLILVGAVVGGDPAYIRPWVGSCDEIIDRIRHLYADNFDDTHGWDLSIWFSLNDPRRLWCDDDPAR